MLQLGEEVEEMDAWGMDCYTRKNLELCLSDASFTKPQIRHFTEHILAPAIHRMPSDIAADIVHALDWIIAQFEGESAMGFGYDIVKAGQTVQLAVKNWGDHNFRLWPKGRGIFCCSEKGIPEGTFVCRYLGEIYPAWMWLAKEGRVIE